MDAILYLLSGGFLAGYRTYVLSALGVATVVASWAVGDQTTQDTARALWELALSLSAASIRAGLK